MECFETDVAALKVCKVGGVSGTKLGARVLATIALWWRLLYAIVGEVSDLDISQERE